MFEGLKKKIFTQEFLEQNPVPVVEQQQTVVEQPKPVARQRPMQTVTVTLDDNSSNPVTSTSNVSSDTDQEMVQKIYDVLGKINKDGIDFFEVWDAAEQMEGGTNATNIKNSFIAMKAASGNKLTKEYVIETGQYYKDQIKTILDSNTKSKSAEKEKATTQWQTEKSQLQTTVTDLAKQIDDLIAEKSQAESSLSKIDSKYKPAIQKIEDQINSGVRAVQSVTQEIQSFIDTFNNIIK